jgi:RNA polymerase sigma-70 factor (ECF subfamily)
MGTVPAVIVAPSEDKIVPGFERIFTAHYRRVHDILVRLVGSRLQAEDLVNEVFWKLYNQPPGAQLWSNPEAWLYRTAANAGIDALRASGRRKQYELAAVHEQIRERSTDGPLERVLRDEDARRVREVLKGMKRAQAQLLLMRASGSSYKEIAETLEIAVSGVGTLLTRAEAEFRKRYLKIL